MSQLPQIQILKVIPRRVETFNLNMISICPGVSSQLDLLPALLIICLYHFSWLIPFPRSGGIQSAIQTSSVICTRVVPESVDSSIPCRSLPL